MNGLLIDFLFPLQCPLCLTPLGLSENPLCGECERDLPRIGEPCCGKCGKPLTSEDEFCADCREATFPFVRNRSLLVYTERGKALIQGYKFRSKRELGRFFAVELLPLFEAIPRPFVIVPVPSVAKKKKKRGWDAVGVIARILHGLYGYRLLFALRKTPGHDQKGLDYENRLKNLKGRIRYTGKEQAPERCVLLDDVFTTGATISECAKVLKEHGAQEVYSVTLALDF